MEKGFMLPGGGYVQVVAAEKVSLNDYPEGTVEVPLKPGTGYEWTGEGWALSQSHRADLRADAFARVDAEHANYLVTLTGGASVAERDTWKIKEEAARAFDAGTATPGQIAMLTTEAQGRGVTEPELAATIIAKADAFLSLVGVAAGLRAQGRAAIRAATVETIPIEQVEPAIEAVFAQLVQQVQAAIEQISSSTEQK